MKTIADLDDFEKLSLEKLTSIHGLGIAKASQILSAIKTIITNQKQNQHLTQLRDFLLPMLMNGQVRVA